jgi:hypothetical protein
VPAKEDAHNKNTTALPVERKQGEGLRQAWAEPWRPAAGPVTLLGADDHLFPTSPSKSALSESVSLEEPMGEAREGWVPGAKEPRERSGWVSGEELNQADFAALPKAERAAMLKACAGGILCASKSCLRVHGVFEPEQAKRVREAEKLTGAALKHQKHMLCQKVCLEHLLTRACPRGEGCHARHFVRTRPLSNNHRNAAKWAWAKLRQNNPPNFKPPNASGAIKLASVAAAEAKALRAAQQNLDAGGSQPKVESAKDGTILHLGPQISPTIPQQNVGKEGTVLAVAASNSLNRPLENMAANEGIARPMSDKPPKKELRRHAFPVPPAPDIKTGGLPPSAQASLKAATSSSALENLRAPKNQPKQKGSTERPASQKPNGNSHAQPQKEVGTPPKPKAGGAPSKSLAKTKESSDAPVGKKGDDRGARSDGKRWWRNPRRAAPPSPPSTTNSNQTQNSPAALGTTGASGKPVPRNRPRSSGTQQG